MASDDLYTVAGASDALRGNRRAVKLALQNVTPDDTSGPYPRWRLSRATAALAAYDAPKFAFRSSNLLSLRRQRRHPAIRRIDNQRRARAGQRVEVNKIVSDVVPRSFAVEFQCCWTRMTCNFPSYLDLRTFLRGRNGKRMPRLSPTLT